MPITLNGDTGITTPMYNGSITANAVTPSVNMKNRLINGEMVIDQRNAGAAITVNNTNLNYSVDRWWGTGKTSDGVYTMQRSASTPPVGFSNFLRVTVTTADASIAAGDTYYMGTKIEGFNVADLGFGSANARTITISFWARSSVTGTFSGALLNGAENRSYPFTFVISAANTWEYETITIAGDTTGTWATDNTAGMVLAIDLGSGSNFRAAAGSWVAAGEYGATGAVTLISTLSATLDITGVQLEVGSTATSFDYRPYGTELALCQRYYWRYVTGNSKNIGVGYYWSSAEVDTSVQFPVTMRATPSLDAASGTDYYGIDRNSATDTFNSFTMQKAHEQSANIYNASQISGTAGQAGGVSTNNASAYVAFSAEL
jgi:hypothetical protein